MKCDKPDRDCRERTAKGRCRVVKCNLFAVRREDLGGEKNER